MRNSTWWTIIVVLLVIIAALAWFVFATPAPVTDSNVTATTAGTVATSTYNTNATMTATTTATVPTVSSPASGATAAKIFVVKGSAPGTWYFEAVFPIEVRNPSGAVVGHGQARAQGNWMTTGMVPFNATTTVTGYSGPATLVLKKDNPSGDPARDASVSIPIVIQ